MVDDARKLNDLVPRESSISIDQASTRLIQRGLAALDQVRTIYLSADGFTALGSSVFVFPVPTFLVGGTFGIQSGRI